MAGVTQLVVLTSAAVLVLAPFVLVAILIRILRRRGTWRALAAPLAFHAAALLIAWVTWRTLRPDDWALSFWATVLAGMDSKTYGHVVEHVAENLAAKVVVLAAAGGLVGARLAWISEDRSPEGIPR